MGCHLNRSGHLQEYLPSPWGREDSPFRLHSCLFKGWGPTPWDLPQRAFGGRHNLLHVPLLQAVCTEVGFSFSKKRQENNHQNWNITNGYFQFGQCCVYVFFMFVEQVSLLLALSSKKTSVQNVASNLLSLIKIFVSRLSSLPAFYRDILQL